MHTGNNKPIASTDQLSHVKKLIKNKILNKSAQSEPQQQIHQQQQQQQRDQHRQPQQSPAAAAATAAAPSSGTLSQRTGQSGGFTVPIAKADLTARSKPPLLLNLFNQLPRQRATCGSMKPQQKRLQASPQRAPRASQVDTPIILAPASTMSQIRAPQTPAATPQPKSPPPLIVLENKVLAPDEKIDLRALRLPNGQSPAVPPTAPPIVAPSPSSTKEFENAAKVKPEAKKPTAPIKKIILNVNKRKLPREEIAQLAKEVHKQAMQHVHQQKPLSTNTQAIKPPKALGSGATNITPTKEIGPSLNTPVTETSISTNPSSSCAIPSSLSKHLFIVCNNFLINNSCN
ncbi:AP2-associated protein kinase 1-like [Drosophila hydei]|uniref:AP2-associated protein kinase 1-like n=1 Tax=Drosophila hydei TaxID=7224 RepID=A0A6J1LKC8_DROHY|nr:AP2-associated protein kinase 1-like [Drosophila hydei]